MKQPLNTVLIVFLLSLVGGGYGETNAAPDASKRIQPADLVYLGAFRLPEGEGGVASGKNYLNCGWALTPGTNHIDTDGSTIDIYVDNLYVGHPVYNNYRQDIAAMFPGYANSNGAVGYFYLDTTRYENGVHSIHWIVTDSAGNADGVGSRYFIIRN